MKEILFIFGCLLALILLNITYTLARKRLNKPIIGKNHWLINLLKRDDYVSVDGKVYQFSHIARENEIIDLLSPPCESNKLIGGELAFYKPNGLGYIYFNRSVAQKIKFIYGKYGVKWAETIDDANIAQDEINRFRLC